MSLHAILKQNTIDSSDTNWHTHVSMVQPRGKFQFNRKSNEEFWDLYCSYIQSNPDGIIGIAEKPQLYTPVRVDIDLKLEDTKVVGVQEQLYSTKHIAAIISIYQRVLSEIITPNQLTNNMLSCILLEKPIYYITAGDKRYAKNGFHLHFPWLFLSKVDQSIHLIPRVKHQVKQLEIFKDLGLQDSSDAIDDSCTTVPWLLYGSRKSEDSGVYKFSKIFDHNCEEGDIVHMLKGYRIFNEQEQAIKYTKEKDIIYYLPRILSIIPYSRSITNLRAGIEVFGGKKQTCNKIRVVNANSSADVAEMLKISSQLLPMLKQRRCEDYNQWMCIGWVLFNIGNGCEEALEQWLEFSSRSEKYDESKCIYEWSRMVKRDKTIGTLRHFAKQDSPEQYTEFIKNSAKPILKKSLDGSHNDIAKVLHTYFQDEFVCASINAKTWFQYRPSEHRWEEIEEGIFLREHISERLVKDYIDYAMKLINEFGSTVDKAEEKMINERRKQVDRIISNLKSAPFKNNVMRECMEVFYDRNFKKKLDQNPMLIGFKNGVYDLAANHFREGTHDDYINKTIPIEYKEFTEVDNEVQDVKEFLCKVFPDKSIRTYFMDTYSDIFVGGNTQKKVYMWTGEGDNAKSITQNFFELMLGELAIKFNTQYFTGKKTATGSANPELSRAAPPVRHVTMEEPDADEQLNIGELKKLSGGDSYWARDLFEKGKSTSEVFPMFTLTFICNKLPKLKYSDKATWNRIRVIPFESTFVGPNDDCPETFEEQMKEKRFPMDRNFKNKIPSMVQAFAWYLLQWRSKITTRIEPQKVREATEIYRKQNDIYRQFIQECIIEDDTTNLSMVELYAQFREWFKESFPHVSTPIKNDVKEYFENTWGTPEPGIKWSGYRIKTLQDDVEAGDVIILDNNDLVKY